MKRLCLQGALAPSVPVVIPGSLEEPRSQRVVSQPLAQAGTREQLSPPLPPPDLPTPASPPRLASLVLAYGKIAGAAGSQAASER